MKDSSEKEAPGSVELLVGGEKIAQFLFGNDTVQERRRVYHLAESHELPVFRVGSTLYARKTKLLEWIEEQEAAKFRGVSP